MTLLIFNNLPASYRTRPFADLATCWHELTGSPTLVVYQARRDSHRRQEWFYSQKGEIPYAHAFLSDDTIRVRGRVTYRPRFGSAHFRSLRPTHLLVPGWDAPGCLSSAAWARLTGARLVSWVESNPSTTHHRGAAANRYRRGFLRSASGVLTPSRASADYVTGLTGREIPTLTLPNPVAWTRLTSADSGPARRLLFVGDLGRRKGYDVFQRAAARLVSQGWTARAFGNDVEGLYDSASGVEWRAGLTLQEIVPSLNPAHDVWVIPSRSDPAPLTYSEAMALGLRVVLSDRVAYAADGAVTGVTVFSSADADALVGAAERAAHGPRPTEAESTRFTSGHWASSVAQFLRDL